MIAVTFALPSESSRFVKSLTQRKRTRHGDIEILTGASDGRSVSVLHTGVGGQVTRARLASYFATETPELLISSGFAGALNDSWKPAELLLAKNFSSPTRHANAQTALPHIRSGTLLTADTIIDSLGARAELGRLHGADAVDMETQFIAEACGTKNIPILSLRAISDTPELPFPAPPAVLFDVERQRTNISGILAHIAARPFSVAKFAAFARQIAAARAALGEALRLLISSEPRR